VSRRSSLAAPFTKLEAHRGNMLGMAYRLDGPHLAIRVVDQRMITVEMPSLGRAAHFMINAAADRASS